MNKETPRTEEKIDRHGRGVPLSGRNGWNRALKLPAQRRGSQKSPATTRKNAQIGLNSERADTKSIHLNPPAYEQQSIWEIPVETNSDP